MMKYTIIVLHYYIGIMWKSGNGPITRVLKQNQNVPELCKTGTLCMKLGHR